jgi:SAM-dependent methyltransferase
MYNQSMASAQTQALDSPHRIQEIRDLIQRKPLLKELYRESYERFRAVVDRSPPKGLVLELGSGGGFIKDVVPETITSDTLPYAGVDLVVNATRMPFKDGELRAVYMLNVFHHIPDVRAFFRELERCLTPGGRVLIADQHRGWISEPILRHAHHEPYRPEAKDWAFDSTGPLSGANGALAWIVFTRDRGRFEREFPGLQIAYQKAHTPLRYWIAGGLKTWSLAPRWSHRPLAFMDRALSRALPSLSSFVDIELVRLP